MVAPHAKQFLCTYLQAIAKGVALEPDEVPPMKRLWAAMLAEPGGPAELLLMCLWSVKCAEGPGWVPSEDTLTDAVMIAGGFGLRFPDDVLHNFERMYRWSLSQTMPEPGSKPKGKATATPNGKRKTKKEWEFEAGLLILDHPDWPDCRVAKEVGRDPSQLSRSDLYQMAAAMTRGDKRYS